MSKVKLRYIHVYSVHGDWNTLQYHEYSYRTNLCKYFCFEILFYSHLHVVIVLYTSEGSQLFLRRAGWDSSATWKGQNCFWMGGGGGEYVRKRTSRARSAKSLAAGVQGPLKGPGSSGVIDALWCNLSLILDHYTECNKIEACFILSQTND